MEKLFDNLHKLRVGHVDPVADTTYQIKWANRGRPGVSPVFLLFVDTTHVWQWCMEREGATDANALALETLKLAVLDLDAALGVFDLGLRGHIVALGPGDIEQPCVSQVIYSALADRLNWAHSPDPSYRRTLAELASVELVEVLSATFSAQKMARNRC